MHTLAVVPIKELGQAKTRLAGVLSSEARSALASRLLAVVVQAIQGCGLAAEVAVVSPDPLALDLARRLGARPLRQHSYGLNAALVEGRAWANSLGADALLVMLGDLPLLTPDDVSGLIRSLGTAEVALAPDRHERGTNALLLRPPFALPFRFGPDSLACHRREAAARALTLVLYRSQGVQFDLDTAEDLREFIRIDDCDIPYGHTTPSFGGDSRDSSRR